MPWKVRADPLRFEEAEAFLRQKVPLTQQEYRALTLQEAQQAFTVAGVAQLDLIHETLQSLQTALEAGTPYEEWTRSIGPRLSAAWGGAKPWRLELIFRQNILGAYAAGRYQQQTDPQVRAVRPYWMYDAVLDSGTTPICRGLNGLIRPADDPAWERIYPPNHFGCRAGVRSLTAREAEARGGVTPLPPGLEVPPGFARPPTARWEPDPAKYPPELWEALQGKLAERIEIGREVLELRGQVSARQKDRILRGLEGLRLNRWMEQNPIRALEIASNLSETNNQMGDYDRLTQTIRLLYPRPDGSWADAKPLGQLRAVSTKGGSALQAAAITLVHEFGHHLYEAMREETENRLFARYIQAKKEGRLVSLRARDGVLEWFSESLAAYRFFRRDFRKFDPATSAMIEDMLVRLR